MQENACKLLFVENIRSHFDTKAWALKHGQSPHLSQDEFENLVMEEMWQGEGAVLHYVFEDTIVLKGPGESLEEIGLKLSGHVTCQFSNEAELQDRIACSL